jgi:glycosyltransferase involved in cell wall biosynthesis
MRIALATYGLHAGGMETFLFVLARRLRRAGHQVAFVVTETLGAWHSVPEDEGFAMYAVLRTNGWADHVKRVAAALSEFDVVLLNHSVIAQAVAGVLPGSVKTVAVLHNDANTIYRVGLSNLANLDGVIAVSPRVRDVATKRAPSSKVFLVRLGVEAVDQAHPKQTSDVLRVAFVGRLEHAQKRVLDLPAILSRARMLGAQVAFDLVGGGPDENELTKALAELNLGMELHIHGELRHRDALTVLAKADVLILPSRFEGFPVILLEALARGVIPVASYLPGITDETVEEGVNGYLVEPGDLDGFARAIVRLAKDTDLRARLAIAALSRSRMFTAEGMANEYLRVLDEVLAGPSRRTGCFDETFKPPGI